ncbi:hypothetical protein ACPCUK_06380 [Streptomyces arboris]
MKTHHSRLADGDPANHHPPPPLTDYRGCHVTTCPLHHVFPST